MVNKLSRKGYLWKTYEGQMALEGITSGKHATAANIWDFSLDESRLHGEDIEELNGKLSKYLDEGTKVKVKYIEMIRTWPWRSETEYLIQDVVSAGVVKEGERVETEGGLEKATPKEAGKLGKEVEIDGRKYMLKHDQNGKLKVMELKEVQ